jgi:hypothetical protein
MDHLRDRGNLFVKVRIDLEADARGGLKQLAPPPADLDTQIWVLTPPDLKRVARIKALTDFLFERLSTDDRLAH